MRGMLKRGVFVATPTKIESRARVARGGPTSECHLECHLVEYVLFYMVIMEYVMKKQNGVEENFQVVYLQTRKVLEE